MNGHIQRLLSPYGFKTVAELTEAYTTVSESLRKLRERNAPKVAGAGAPEPEVGVPAMPQRQEQHRQR